MAKAYHPVPMRTAKYWVPAFVVLFVCYQDTAGIAHQQMLMLAFLPVAWLVARALNLGMGAAYALEWNRKTAWLLGGGFHRQG
jgi:hypothetical protein